MSNEPHATTRTVRLSVWLYKRLLVLYPQPFRQQYGAHMVQVFRDCCREAAYSDGAIGLWRFWLIASGDLIVSALAERRREGFPMTSTTWIRLGSLAAIVGGSTLALSQIPTIAITVATERSGGDIVQLLDDLYFQHEAWAATPVIWLLIALALICLRSWGPALPSALGRASVAIGVVGAVLIGFGNVSVDAVSLSLGVACVSPACVTFDGHNFSSVGRLAILIGTGLFLSSMILYGIAALRHRTLDQRWRNILPLVIGVLAVLVWALLNYQLSMATHQLVATYNGSPLLQWFGLPHYLQIAWFHVPPNLSSDVNALAFMMSLSTAPQVYVMIVVMNLLFALSWILLGITTWPRGTSEMTAQSASASIEPAI